MTKKKESREARNLILLLSSATFIAFVVVVGLVYYFGTAGTYLLRDMLISPDSLQKSVFLDASGKAAEGYVLEKIEFVLPDKQGTGWGRFTITQESYAKFFKHIYGERSVPVVTEGMAHSFSKIAPATLTIYVKEKEHLGKEARIYQQLQFSAGSDIFRFRFYPLPAKGESESVWLYFRFPGIYQDVVELFAPKN